jgi:hypothetical protein
MLSEQTAAMDLHREAEAHLRTIRSLMERATVYRAISAPTALVAAVLGIGCGLVPASALPAGGAGWDFKLLWLGALVLTLAANAWFIRRSAHRRGDRFVSPGMRLAAHAVAPPALCGLLATVVLEPARLPAVWMACYGLALLATAPFAPRAIVRLGWSFLLLGLAFVLDAPGEGLSPQWKMAGAFGGIHLAYALSTWRQETAEEPPAVPGPV